MLHCIWCLLPFYDWIQRRAADMLIWILRADIEGESDAKQADIAAPGCALLALRSLPPCAPDSPLFKCPFTPSSLFSLNVLNHSEKMVPSPHFYFWFDSEWICFTKKSFSCMQTSVCMSHQHSALNESWAHELMNMYLLDRFSLDNQRFLPQLLKIRQSHGEEFQDVDIQCGVNGKQEERNLRQGKWRKRRWEKIKGLEETRKGPR